MVLGQFKGFICQHLSRVVVICHMVWLCVAMLDSCVQEGRRQLSMVGICLMVAKQCQWGMGLGVFVTVIENMNYGKKDAEVREKERVKVYRSVL